MKGVSELQTQSRSYNNVLHKAAIIEHNGMVNSMDITRCPPKYSAKQSLLAMLGVSSGLMLSALDQTVIGNALPSIVSDLNGFEFYAWIATSYLLMSIVTIPIFGRLGDYYGRKPFIVLACLIFTVASLVCALSTSIIMLVVARAAQGLGGGMLIATAFASIPDLFPDNKERLKWQIFLSTAFSIVNAMGPPLGGFLTDYWGWRSIFYLNIPLGCLAVFFSWKFIPWIKHVEYKSISLDGLGALLIAIVLICFQLFVEQFSTVGFNSLVIMLGSILLGITGLLYYWEQHVEYPLLPPALFKINGLKILFSSSIMAGAVMFSLLYYTPLMFQGALGYSAHDAGILVTPMVLSITLGAIINSRVIVQLQNPNWLPKCGFMLLVTACIGLGLSHINTHFYVLLVLMLLSGCGLGFILINLTLFTQNSVNRTDLGIATALLQSLRLVGGMLGTTVMGVLVNAIYRDVLSEKLKALGMSHFFTRMSNPNILLDNTLNIDKVFIDLAREALLDALSLGFFILATIALLALVVLGKLKPTYLFTKQ